MKLLTLGHPLLIVNGASIWGITDREYIQLQRLHDQYSTKGVNFIVFPCNQFAAEEPGTNEEIKQFLTKYNYKGDLAAKIDVNGKNQHPLWSWLKQQNVSSLKKHSRK